MRCSVLRWGRHRRVGLRVGQCLRMGGRRGGEHPGDPSEPEHLGGRDEDRPGRDRRRGRGHRQVGGRVPGHRTARPVAATPWPLQGRAPGPCPATASATPRARVATPTTSPVRPGTRRNVTWPPCGLCCNAVAAASCRSLPARGVLPLPARGSGRHDRRARALGAAAVRLAVRVGHRATLDQGTGAA